MGIDGKKLFFTLIWLVIITGSLLGVYFNGQFNRDEEDDFIDDNNSDDSGNNTNQDNSTDDGTTNQTEPQKITIDEYVPPKLLTVNYINLDNISRISRFRSGAGHDYSDDHETCRSMKHYFVPHSNITWSDVEIYSPMDGYIYNIYPEWAGVQIHIRSYEHPEIEIRIFHAEIDSKWSKGDNVSAGERLGVHVGTDTFSDIAIFIQLDNVENYTWSYFSYFDVLTDQAFAQFANYGITNRTQMIISREERDQYPLCEDGAPNPIPDWVYLNKTG